MRKSRLIAWLAFSGLLGAWPACAEELLLLRGATVHPVTGKEIPNGSVLIRGSRIAEVGAKVAVPKGARVVDLKGQHIYPGMIDAATQLGMTEVPGVPETTDINELGLFKPQLHALAAVNPGSEHIPVTRANGITTVLVQPGGGIIAGQPALIHLDGWTWEEMRLRAPAAMRIDFPQIGGAGPALPFAESKRRYESQVRDLDAFFEQARRYQRARAAGGADFSPDLKFEAMLPVLEGTIPVLVHAERERTIRAALEFARKQKLRIVLHEARDAWKLAPELKARNVPVILGPTLDLPAEEDEPYDRVFTIPGDLYKAGVKFAIATFGPTASTNPRSLPYQAAAAAAFGLPREEALKAVTISPAEILGVASDIGSVEAGKLADLMVTDGDPLEITTQVLQVYISGKLMDLENKHHRLYQKYLERP